MDENEDIAAYEAAVRQMNQEEAARHGITAAQLAVKKRKDLAARLNSIYGPGTATLGESGSIELADIEAVKAKISADETGTFPFEVDEGLFEVDGG